nr:SusF/SusE family outer membrane protein [Prevotella sp.]
YGKAGVLRSIAATVANKVVLEKGEGFLLSSDMTSLVKLIKPNFEEFIYEIGNDSGWGTVQYVRSPEMDGNYTGYCYLNGEFKFRSHVDSWDAPDWEYGGTEGSLSENGTGNFADPGKGFYKVEASLANGTLKLTKIDAISIIGSVLDANWGIDGDMTFDESEKAWTWSGHLDAGEMKFRVNHDWAISWGGANGDAKAYGNLTEKEGKNLVVDEAGEYTVKLFITYEGNNRVELTKN